MAKVGIALLGFALLASCSYDAGRLLRPTEESSVADASRSDTSAGQGHQDAREADRRDAGVVDPRDADTRKKDGAVGDAGKSSTAGNDPDMAGGKSLVATFVAGRAQGALSGYGSVSLGVVDSVTSPTCNGMQIGGVTPSMPPVTFNSTCRPSAITWGTATGLCASGTIAGWSANPSYVDSMIDWGILVGVATGEPVQALGVAYDSITLTVSGWSSGTLFAVVHLADDASNLTYCARMTSGNSIKLSSFNTECFFGNGKSLCDSDMERIDKIGVQVPSSQSPSTLSDFCLTQIELAK
jgi:hypothetical protein